MITTPPLFVLEEIRRRRERRRPIWRGAVITSAFVAVGFVVASMAFPPALPPDGVAKAYVQARFDRDWSAAWDLLCQRVRVANGGFRAYAESAASGFRLLPWDVDVSTGSMHGLDGSAIAVPVTVRTQDPLFKDRDIHGDVVVVLEDHEFRVCDRSLGSG